MGHQNECVDNKARCKKNMNGRSSTTLFYVRGGPSGLRMDYAETTDFALVEPYPAHTEQINIITNRVNLVTLLEIIVYTMIYYKYFRIFYIKNMS